MKILPHIEQETQDFGGLMNKTPVLDDSFRSAMFDDFMLSYNESSMSDMTQPAENALRDIGADVDNPDFRREEVKVIDYVEEASREVAKQAVDTPPQDMKVSREDWEDIKKGLKERGVKDRDIEELEEKVFSEEGLTYGQLVLNLTEMLQDIKGISLNPVQMQNVRSMLSKLGFNAQESKQLISDLTRGNFESFMGSIQEKLASLPADQELNLSKDEAATLANIFKLSGKDAQKVTQLLTKGDAKVADLRNAFASLRSAMEKMAESEDLKDIKLSELVGKTLHEAMNRESDQAPSIVRMADATTIKDSMGAAKEVAKDAQAGANNQASGQNANRNGGNNQQGHEGKEQQAGNGNQQANENNQNRHWLEDILADNKDAKAWTDFFGKIRVENTDLGSGGLERLMGSVANNTAKNLSNLAESAKNNPMWEKTARSNVLEQVQNGIFRNLGNGTKQLVLKLNPAELGSINVMLQVKNKEVNAVIRAENPDSARMISEQLDKLRAALEQQGLKVDKLDVQTNLADSQSQSSWQGADQHNNAQQNQDFMSGLMKRWRSLRGGDTSLAQEMQNMGDKAIISQSGLHVVA